MYETFYDLFCGIGGFRLGLEKNGLRCVGSCEWDKHAREIYRKNFGEYPSESNATEINPEELPDFDILTAGFPCQAFSVAGKRRGFEESRGTVFFEIAILAISKKPKLLLLENVKGILSHDEGRTFETILQTLDEIGYDVEWQVLNSKYFVPQNRERVFIIGYIRGTSRPKIFPLGEICQVSSGEKESLSVRCFTFGEKTNGLHSQMTMLVQPKIIFTPVVNDGGNLRETRLSNNLDANYWKGIDNHGQRTMIYISQLMIRDGRDNRSCLRAGRTPELGIKGKSIRRLTPKECERLQGFPDGWTEGVSDTHRYKCLGNAVTVNVIEYLGKALVA